MRTGGGRTSGLAAPIGEKGPAMMKAANPAFDFGH